MCSLPLSLQLVRDDITKDSFDSAIVVGISDRSGERTRDVRRTFGWLSKGAKTSSKVLENGVSHVTYSTNGYATFRVSRKYVYHHVASDSMHDGLRSCYVLVIDALSIIDGLAADPAFHLRVVYTSSGDAKVGKNGYKEKVGAKILSLYDDLAHCPYDYMLVWMTYEKSPELVLDALYGFTKSWYYQNRDGCACCFLKASFRLGPSRARRISSIDGSSWRVIMDTGVITHSWASVPDPRIDVNSRPTPGGGGGGGGGGADVSGGVGLPLGPSIGAPPVLALPPPPPPPPPAPPRPPTPPGDLAGPRLGVDAGASASATVPSDSSVPHGVTPITFDRKDEYIFSRPPSPPGPVSETVLPSPYASQDWKEAVNELKNHTFRELVRSKPKHIMENGFKMHAPVDNRYNKFAIDMGLPPHFDPRSITPSLAVRTIVPTVYYTAPYALNSPLLSWKFWDRLTKDFDDIDGSRPVNLDANGKNVRVRMYRKKIGNFGALYKSEDLDLVSVDGVKRDNWQILPHETRILDPTARPVRP